MTAVTLRVRVKPRANRSSLEQLPDGTWVATLKSSPVDGKANKELVGLVAERFDCRTSVVRITSGATGRIKLVRVGRE